MRAFWFALFVLLAAPAARARIGETVQECRERYGEPVRVTGENVKFVKADYTIFVSFAKGRAVLIMFCRSKLDATGGHEPMSENEIGYLLRVNSSRHVWKRVPDTSAQRRWMTSDDALMAIYELSGHFLTIGGEKVGQGSKEEKTGRLQGF